MSDLYLQIQNMLMEGNDALTISKFLQIPITWIYETSDDTDIDINEDYNPFNTINS